MLKATLVCASRQRRERDRDIARIGRGIALKQLLARQAYSGLLALWDEKSDRTWIKAKGRAYNAI